MADRKRAASEEPTTSTGTRKSARATAAVDVFKPSAFGVSKDSKNQDEVFRSLPDHVRNQAMMSSLKAFMVKYPDRALKANLVTSLKAENDDLAERLAASEKKSIALDKALKTEKEKNVKLRQDFMEKQYELMEGLSDLRSDIAPFCVQQ